MRLSLSDTHVMSDASMSLLSVPALVKKDITVLFMLRYATLFDFRDDFKVFCYATKDPDGLFYANKNASASATRHVKNHIATVRAMIAKNTHNTKKSKDRVKRNDHEDTAAVWHLCMGHFLPILDIRSQIKSGTRPNVKHQKSE